MVKDCLINSQLKPSLNIYFNRQTVPKALEMFIILRNPHFPPVHLFKSIRFHNQSMDSLWLNCVRAGKPLRRGFSSFLATVCWPIMHWSSGLAWPAASAALEKYEVKMDIISPQLQHPATSTFAFLFEFGFGIGFGFGFWISVDSDSCLLSRQKAIKKASRRPASPRNIYRGALVETNWFPKRESMTGWLLLHNWPTQNAFLLPRYFFCFWPRSSGFSLGQSQTHRFHWWKFTLERWVVSWPIEIAEMAYKES